MLKYYEINGKTCFTDHMDFQCPPEADWKEIPEPRTAEELSWLFFREPGSCRASFLVNHEGLLWEKEESVDWLNSRKLEENKAFYGKQDGCTEGKCAAALPEWIRERITAGKIRAVNASHPRFLELLSGEAFPAGPEKKRVHILAIGDVGSMLLTGLHLLGGDVISRIGICDISDQVTARWEFEENQIAYPWEYDALPEVEVVKPENLFDCDVFVFVASKGIPPVGSGVKDVRMYSSCAKPELILVPLYENKKSLSVSELDFLGMT